MPSTTAEHTWVVRRAQICQSARSERDLSRLFVCSTPLIGASPHICPSPPATALLCCNLLLWRSHTSAWLVLLLTRNTRSSSRWRAACVVFHLKLATLMLQMHNQQIRRFLPVVLPDYHQQQILQFWAFLGHLRKISNIFPRADEDCFSSRRSANKRRLIANPTLL